MLFFVMMEDGICWIFWFYLCVCCVCEFECGYCMYGEILEFDDWWY